LDNITSCFFKIKNKKLSKREVTCRKTTFVDCYNNIILPNNGPKLWPNVKGLPIQPPYVRRAPGRPKKARRKANDEPNPKRMKKAPGTVTCDRCKGVGHNKRSSKGKTPADRLIPKGGNKVIYVCTKFDKICYVCPITNW
jgi:hypothetical protein